MAGRESSGNPSGEQGGRDRSGRGMVRQRSPQAPRPYRKNPLKTTKVSSPSKERREWERAVKKKDEERRRKYRAVRGKVVDWVDHWIEEGWLFVSIRFQDKTDLRLQFGAKMVTDEIDLYDVSGGKLELVRQYFRRRGI